MRSRQTARDSLVFVVSNGTAPPPLKAYHPQNLRSLSSFLPFSFPSPTQLPQFFPFRCCRSHFGFLGTPTHLFFPVCTLLPTSRLSLSTPRTFSPPIAVTEGTSKNNNLHYPTNPTQSPPPNLNLTNHTSLTHTHPNHTYCYYYTILPWAFHFVVHRRLQDVQIPQTTSQTLIAPHPIIAAVTTAAAAAAQEKSPKVRNHGRVQLLLDLGIAFISIIPFDSGNQS